MKKIIAFVLALVMILSLGTVAFAASAAREKIIRFVPNAIANALATPATYLANYVIANQENIVGGINTLLPAAYYGLENSATALNTAIQLGAKAAEANVVLTMMPGVLTTGLVTKLLNNLDGGESVKALAEKTANLNETLSGLMMGIAKEIDGIAEGLGSNIAKVFHGTVGDIREEYVGPISAMTVEELIVPEKWKENMMAEDYAEFKAAYEETFESLLNAMLLAEPGIAKEYSAVLASGEQKALDDFYLKHGDIKNSAMKAASAKTNFPADPKRIEDLENFFDIDEGMSVVSNFVNGVLPTFAEILKAPKTFADGGLASDIITYAALLPLKLLQRK